MTYYTLNRERVTSDRLHVTQHFIQSGRSYIQHSINIQHSFFIQYFTFYILPFNYFETIITLIHSLVQYFDSLLDSEKRSKLQSNECSAVSWKLNTEEIFSPKQNQLSAQQTHNCSLGCYVDTSFLLLWLSTMTADFILHGQNSFSHLFLNYIFFL